MTGHLHPTDPDLNKRFRHCQNFCDSGNYDNEIRREYTQYELTLRAKFDEFSRRKDAGEGEHWEQPGGDTNLHFKDLGLKDKAGTVFNNLAAGFTRISRAISKAGSMNGKPGGYIGGAHPVQLKGVP